MKTSRDQIEASIKNTFEKILKLYRSKAEEYSESNDDALSNFTRDAADTGLSPEMVLRIFATKHWRTITDYCDEIGDSSVSRKRSEPLENRIDDLITYLCMLKYMVILRSTVGDSPPPAKDA